MKIISWNIDGTQSVLRKSEFNSILWMLNADIFAFQETKLLEPDYRLRFPGTNAYWSFCESGDTTHPRSGTAVFSKKKAKDCFTTFLSNPAFDTEGRM